MAGGAGFKNANFSPTEVTAAMGAEGFIRAVKRGVPDIGREAPFKREMKRLRTFDEVVGAVESVKGEDWKDFLRRHGDYGRDMALMLARECTGMTLRAIGLAAGGMDYAAVGEAIKRLRIVINANHQLESDLEKARHLLNIET